MAIYPLPSNKRSPTMRRPDPYQHRARELCIADGVDPDSRIDRPGQRSMPAWCAYREAARKEHPARETAATAEGIAALGAQAPEFQNSPLTVFGQHDQATVAQMRNCMTVGNVVGGVLCADGHLGYAQPVGGVIAYEKQISISGVGFDIACGNMAVRLDIPFVAIRDNIMPIARDIAADGWKASGMEDYRQKAAAQLGTVGSGNHYVDLMRDEAGLVWIGVHFGSRGLAIRTERGGNDITVVTRQLGESFTCSRIPDAGNLAISSNDACTVRIERCREDHFTLSHQLDDNHACLRVPNACGLVSRDGDNTRALRAERCRDDAVIMPFQLGENFTLASGCQAAHGPRRN
jgi:tRNA-splicing ligase RtcB